jgi:hypothetical protein
MVLLLRESKLFFINSEKLSVITRSVMKSLVSSTFRDAHSLDSRSDKAPGTCFSPTLSIQTKETPKGVSFVSGAGVYL